MKAPQAPRGTQDILPADQPYWDLVRQTAADVARRYGFQRIETPMFEDTSVFIRGVGQGTDIVEKEMYTFEDKGGASITLRAEGTAPVMRAFLEHGMHKLPQPVKVFYVSPIFRYERPQAGRWRQHHQFGVEAIGEIDPMLDAEVIELLHTFLSGVGVGDFSLQLNSIGDQNCRPAYLEELKRYYAAHLNEVCDDDRIRFQKNPLRMLDCKVPSCQAVANAAPHIADYLCEACATHFAALRRSLDLRGLAYELNFRLVRGLDYYTKTVFEMVPARGGSTSVLGAGGRYDGLAEQLGGPPTPGIGFGSGLERIILNYRESHADGVAPAKPDVFLVALGAAEREAATRLAVELRRDGLAVASTYGERGMGAQFKAAGNSGARYAVILGADELARGEAGLKNLATGEQTSVALSGVAATIRAT